MEKLTLGEKIRLLREKQSLTLEQVGDKVGVGKSTVRKWETGEIANMRRDKIALLSDALSTTPAYLMGWDEELYLPTSKEPDTSNVAQQLTDMESKILEKCREMNEEGQERVVVFIDDLIYSGRYEKNDVHGMDTKKQA